VRLGARLRGSPRGAARVPEELARLVRAGVLGLGLLVVDQGRELAGVHAVADEQHDAFSGRWFEGGHDELFRCAVLPLILVVLPL